MRSFLEKFCEYLIEFNKARAATAMARLGRFEEAQKIITKEKEPKNHDRA